MVRLGPAGSPMRRLSPQGRWARASGVALSVCVHAAIVLLLIIGLSDQDLRLGGGGGGGSGGGGGLGEGTVMVALPAAMPLAAAPDPAEQAQADPQATLLEPLTDAPESLETAETLPLPMTIPTEVVALPTRVAAPVLEAKTPTASVQPRATAVLPPVPEEAPSLELAPLPPAQPAPAQPLVAAAPPPEAPVPEQPVADPLAEAPASAVLETDLLQSALQASDQPGELAPKTEEEPKPLEAAPLPSRTLTEAPEALQLADEVREAPIEEEPLPDLPMQELAEPLQAEPTTDPLPLEEVQEELAQGETEPLALTDEALPTDLLAMQAGALQPTESDAVALQAALVAIPELEEERQGVAMALREVALETEAQRPEESDGMIVPPRKPNRAVTLPEVPRPKQVAQATRKPEPRKDESRETRMAALASQEADRQVMGRQAEQSGKGQSLNDGGGGEQGRPGTGGQGSAGAGAGLSGAAASGYADQIAAWLERHKRYPRTSRRMGEQGVVTLQFTLDGQGRVLGHRIVRSSGHDRLDQEVLALLERASPMPKPPGSAQRISLAVPIVFSLR